MHALVDLPEIESLDGIPYAKMSPKRTHMLVQGALVEVFRKCGRPGGYIGPELRCRVGAVDGTDTVLVPDVAYVAKSRLFALPDAEREEPPFSPDVAAEVRSPSEPASFREDKIDRYLKTGAVLVLDVDPARRRILAYAKEGVRVFETGDVFSHAAAEWLVFDVGYIFDDLDK
jgi:Uma2 family endonuclease